MIKNLLKAKIKSKLRRPLSGLDRIILASTFSKIDRIPIYIVPTNVHPSLIDPKIDFIQLAKSIDANIGLLNKVQDRFNKVDGYMTANWVPLLGCGAAEMGTTYTITPSIEPTPEVYALDRMKFEDLKFPKYEGYLEKNIELTIKAQDTYPNMMNPPMILGPFDLAVFLRGEKLFSDLLLHKSFLNAKTDKIREKIKKRGDPEFYPKLMEFTLEASMHIANLYKENGANMIGMTLINQYAYLKSNG